MKIKNYKIKAGFTLIELLVSIAITALIMVGLSVFFSNSFQNVFSAQKQVDFSLSEVAFNNVLQKNLLKSSSLQAFDSQKNEVIIKNDPQKTLLPFTYFGEQDSKIAFKDFIVFNGQEGNKAGQDFSDEIRHPAGLTQLNGKYYVASPLENAIYECNNSCQKLALEGLKYPIDLANDGADLFVSDAGHNRVLKITQVGTGNEVEVLGENFNFPTGLEYYEEAEKKFLFVSDTYHHQVKKIDLLDKKIIVVAGGGNNKNCDNTSLYCELNEPMGLVVGNDGIGPALYVVDNGSGRILKIYNPPALEQFEVVFNSPETPQAFKEIKITFPKNTDLTNAQLDSIASEGEVVSGAGNVEILENIFVYQLWTQLLNNTQSTNNCEPKPCLILNNKIEVVHPELFDTGQFNELKLAEEPNNPFTVISKAGVKLTLGSLFTQSYEPGTEVVLNKKIPANTPITLTFSQVNTELVSGGFKPVMVQMTDETGKFLASKKIFFRFSNSELGTSEDMIQVVSSDHPYPTGIGFSGNAPVFSPDAIYPEIFEDLDYVSDFEVEDFDLSKKLEDKLLEVRFKVPKNEELDDVEEEEMEEKIFNISLDS